MGEKEKIDFYIDKILTKEDKLEECEKNLFDDDNIFLFSLNEKGKYCQRIYKKDSFKNKYNFITVENKNPDENLKNKINLKPKIGILLSKNEQIAPKVKEIIYNINKDNNYLSRLLKYDSNYNFDVRSMSRNKHGDFKFEIISDNKSKNMILPNNNNSSNNNANRFSNIGRTIISNNNLNSNTYSNKNSNMNNNMNYNMNSNMNNNMNYNMNNNMNYNMNNNMNNNMNYNMNNNMNFNMNNNINNIVNNNLNNNINNNVNNIYYNNNIINQNKNNINSSQGNNYNGQMKSSINFINSNTTSSTNPNQMNNINQIQNGSNSNANQNQDQNNQNNPIYLFPKIGLNNIGSTCYMNATLQCLLHVSELTVYFLREYPNDKNNLNEKNKLIESHGQISNVFYELVKGVCEDEYKIKKNLNLAKLHNSMNDSSNYSGSHKNFEKVEPNLSSSNTVISRSSFSPYNFKKTLGIYNSQFKKFEANDSKDLILYLMQTMHEELNYFGGNNSINLARPNQYDKVNTFMYFMNSYNALNFSIISNIFYGTYENATLCYKCKKLLYNYQKFEFISFGMYDYRNKVFDIYNGFEDNSKPQQLMGENQFYCNTCKKLVDAEITSKIIQPPNKLLINIDYGKNKAFKPSQVKFGEIIDITKYVCFDFGAPIKYKIIGVCTHLGYSGSYGHYIAYCKHRETGDWFNFNDSSCRKCNKDEIYGGSPYLLLYEKI